MFVWSVRSTSIKFALFGAALAVAVGTLIAVLPRDERALGAYAVSSVDYDGVENASDAADFLSGYGWEVKKEPLEEEDVTIPDEFDKVFINYNEIQKRQGLDLSKYKRKTAKRYTFEVLNYPEASGRVLANVIVYRGKVIAGDICSAEPDGFVSGFSGE